MQYYSPETVPAYEERNVWLKLCWLRMIYSVKTTDTVMLLALGSAYSLSSVLTHFQHDKHYFVQYFQLVFLAMLTVVGMLMLDNAPLAAYRNVYLMAFFGIQANSRLDPTHLIYFYSILFQCHSKHTQVGAHQNIILVHILT